MRDDTKTIQTEFNSNLATLIRIDMALKMASNCSINDDFNGWFKALGIVMCEVIVKIDKSTKTTKEICLGWFGKLEKDLALMDRNKGKSFFNTKIDNDLRAFEIYLREIMNKKGMLLRDGEDEGFKALK